jgi:hypothetical protein
MGAEKIINDILVSVEVQIRREWGHKKCQLESTLKLRS